MSDLEILEKIEKQLDLKLYNVDISELFNQTGYKSYYSINKNEKVIGIVIHSGSTEILKLVSRFEFLTHLKLVQYIISNIEPLKELKNLKNLNLAKNQITNISIIKELKHLTEINLSENQIDDISAINELKDLNKLILAGNHIIDISAIEGLNNLSELLLANNQISNISVLCGLKNLEKLSLKNNKINDISSLKELTGLTILGLGGNQITDISPLKNLKKLAELYLWGNKICDITAIKDLKKLSVLQLYDNMITDISVVKYLKKLQELNLRRNPIEELPNWIIDLNMDIIWNEHWDDFGIALYDNPLKSPPIEIVKEGKHALKSYFESFENEVFLYEAKLVIVGRGFAGKTVLAKKLLDTNFKLPEKEESTKGINVIKEKLELYIEDYSTNFKYHIWDFGGQEKYDATHQFFITENSLYLFVTEARQESNYLDFDFWLNTIELFAHDAPVIVVMSKIDKRKKDLPKNIYKDKYDNIFEFAEVSCADKKENTIENLKNHIVEATKGRLKLIKFPSETWKVIPSIIEQRASTENYVSYKEYLALCNEQGIDETKAEVLLKYLHDLGIVLYRKDDLLLKNMVIINIDWCVDGAYKVLDNKKVGKCKGMFTDRDLTEIWNDEKYSGKQPELLNLMKKYKLCFELRDKTGYIAPNLLPEDKPANIKWDSRDNLLFEYRYVFMPAGLLTRFIVESHTFIKEDKYWKYGVILEFEQTQAFITEDYSNRKVTISLMGQNKKGMLNTIRMYFKEIHSEIKKLQWEEMIQCNCYRCRQNNAPHFYKYSTLSLFQSRGNKITFCEKSAEEVNIQSLINDTFPKPSQYISSNEDLQKFISSMLDKVSHNISFKEGYSYLWRDKECNKEPKFETEIHPYICNILEANIEANGIQLSREVKEASGSVDIFFSYTNKEQEIVKTCIEVKKAEHVDVEKAIGTQLKAYLDAMKVKHGIYLVLWFYNKEYQKPNNITKQELEKAISSNIPKGYSIEVKIIDCNKPYSPSKIK